MNKKFTKPLKCAINQAQPFFTIHDGHNHTQAYWTQECYENFMKENTGYPVSKLKDFMI